MILFYHIIKRPHRYTKRQKKVERVSMSFVELNKPQLIFVSVCSMVHIHNGLENRTRLALTFAKGSLGEMNQIKSYYEDDFCVNEVSPVSLHAKTGVVFGSFSFLLHCRWLRKKVSTRNHLRFKTIY